ncbi:hypothetical protein [Mycobacteroides abscessus]|uniref:hypothetical protein n=1 Tax=Mycobacteroides abscessus TaxID=36809 RepID=UPI0007F97F0A|nr:hypothetical protein [Mycobacteroides abscessus]ANN98212.1 hypothetical protein BAB74_05245 [Mycobacteroides abscessus]
MVKVLGKWRDQLLDRIADKVTAAIDRRIGAVLDRIGDRLVERLDGAIDRITDQIPGTIDDKLLDGLVGRMAKRFPLLDSLASLINLPGSLAGDILKGRK